MARELELVCFDTGIYVAAVLRRLPTNRHLAPRMTAAAAAGAFRLLVLDGVVEEYRRIADREHSLGRAEDDSIRFLEACPYCEWPASPPPEVIEKEHPRFLEVIPHVADARIAVEVAAFEPDYFVHCNPSDWSSRANTMCRTEVVTIRGYLRRHGINMPTGR